MADEIAIFSVFHWVVLTWDGAICTSQTLFEAYVNMTALVEAVCQSMQIVLIAPSTLFGMLICCERTERLNSLDLRVRSQAISSSFGRNAELDDAEY